MHFYTFLDALFNFLSVFLPSLLSFVQLLEFKFLQLLVIKPISDTIVFSWRGLGGLCHSPPFVEQARSDRGKGPPRKAVYSLSLLFLCNWSHSTSMGGRLQRHAAVGGRSACARGLEGQKTTASLSLTTHTFDECVKLRKVDYMVIVPSYARGTWRELCAFGVNAKLYPTYAINNKLLFF